MDNPDASTQYKNATLSDQPAWSDASVFKSAEAPEPAVVCPKSAGDSEGDSDEATVEDSAEEDEEKGEEKPFAWMRPTRSKLEL